MKTIQSIRIQTKKSRFLRLIILFALVYYNNETFPSINYSGPLNTTIILFMLIASLFFIHILVKELKLKNQATMIAIFMTLSVFATMLFNSDVTGGYIKILMCLIIGYMMIHLMSFDDFINSYINVMLMLTVYSLVMMYVLRPVVFNMPEIIFPRIYNSMGLPLIDTRLSYVVNIDNYYRNFGIFREAGVYQIFLNFALMFELFYKKTKLNLKNAMILSVGILSTFSTPGYLTGAILIGGFILSKKNKHLLKKNHASKKKILLFVSIILVGAFILYLTNHEFNIMFTRTIDKLVQKESSYQGRIVALSANLLTWIEKPLFGNGITIGLLEKTLTRMKTGYDFSTVHNTSTIGALLATFGMLFTGIYLYLLFKLIGKSKQRRLLRGFMFLGILITINTQLLIYNELLYTIIFYGLCENKQLNRNPDLQKNNNFDIKVRKDYANESTMVDKYSITRS